MSMKEYLKKFINELLKKERPDHISYIIKHNYKNECNQIIKETNYLSEKCKFTERLYHIINDLLKVPKCKECEINYVKFRNFCYGYNKFCSNKCMGDNKETKEKRKQTNLKKFGVENSSQSEEIKEKKKQTCLKNYKVEYPFQSKEIREKRRQTNLRKYGVEYTSQIEEIKEKKKQTCLKNYGVECQFKNKEIKDKIKNINLENFYKKLSNSNRLKDSIEPLFNIDEYKGVKNEYYKFKCKKCNNEFLATINNGKTPRCYNCFPIENRFTIPHRRIIEYLDKLKINYETEKYIDPYYVDIFIEPNKIIEIYGNYWHCNPKIYKSTFYNERNKRTAQEIWKYDKKREEHLKSKNYEVLVLWEKEINENFEEVKEKIQKYLTRLIYKI